MANTDLLDWNLQGNLFVGVVCSGENGGGASDLEAYVYQITDFVGGPILPYLIFHWIMIKDRRHLILVIYQLQKRLRVGLPGPMMQVLHLIIMLILTRNPYCLI